MPRTARLLAPALLIVVFAAGQAGATQQAAIATSGDPAPGAGGSFDVFYGVFEPNASGEVTFTSSVSGGTATYGVFRASPAHEALALEGDAAPGTGGGSFDYVIGLSMNAAGDVLFAGSSFVAPLFQGFFVGGDAGVAPLFFAGEPAPGTGGGSISDFSSAALDDLGRVVFTGVVSGGSVASGLFRWDAGTLAALVLEGEPAPGTGGGSFSGFLGEVATNAAGEVAFYASVAGGSATEGIFRDSGSGTTAVAVSGDPAPGGGSFTSFEGLPSLNASGEVAFTGDVAGVPGDGIFVESGGSLTAVARVGDSAPGTTGAYEQLLSPDLNDSGDVAFQASIDDPPGSGGLFARRAGSVELVVLNGDPAPGGGSFISTGPPKLAGNGDVVYHGTALDGSTPRWGIFRATQGAAVPGLGPLGLLASALGLLAAGRSRSRAV